MSVSSCPMSITHPDVRFAAYSEASDLSVDVKPGTLSHSENILQISSCDIRGRSESRTGHLLRARCTPRRLKRSYFLVATC